MSESGRTPTQQRLRRLAVAFGAVSLLLAIVSVRGSLDWIGQPFPGFFTWQNGVLVSLDRSHWTGVTLPLGRGVVVSVDGTPLASGADPVTRARAVGAGGTSIRYEIDGPSGRIERSVEPMVLTASDYVMTLGSYLLNGLALLAVGVISLWLRPDLPAARALALATGVLGALLLLAIDYMTTYRYVVLCRVAEALAPAALTHLALIFPRPVASPRTRSFAIGGLVLGLGGLTLASGVVYFERPEFSLQVASLVYSLVAVALLGLIVNCAITARRATQPRERVAAAVVLAGWLPAFSLAAAGMLALTLFGLSFSWSWIFALLPLAAASTAYAVLRHNLLQAERFARLSAGYSLASAVMFLCLAGALALGGQWISGVSVTDPAVSLFLLLGLAVFFDPVRRRLQRVIDQTFYRSTLDGAAELEALSVTLATLVDEHEIARAVQERLCEGMELKYARLRIDDVDDSGAPLCRLLRFRGEPMGSLDCGPKRSGAPFSPEEEDFVEGVAAQAALALHNRRAILGRREAQEALLRSAQLSAVGEFAQTVAHGIRNPVAGVRALAEMTRNRAASAEDLDRAALVASMESVLSETGRVEYRIRTLLDYAQPRDVQMQEAELGALLEEVSAAMASYAERAGVAIRVEKPPLRWTRELDRSFFIEALLELATNAVHAMPEGGALTLRLEGDRIAPVIEVEDTGGGVAEANRERIFELSFTTRTEGMGMGLAKSREIIEAHGATLALARSGPAGSIFRIEFRA